MGGRGDQQLEPPPLPPVAFPVLASPPLPAFLSIVKRLHQESVSPNGKFGFHVTPFYGPPPMIVDWTDNWEFFWTREFRSGLKYALRERGDDPELEGLSEVELEAYMSRGMANHAEVLAEGQAAASDMQGLVLRIVSEL